MNRESFYTEIIDQTIHHLNENTDKINRCLDELTEDEVWKRPNKASNSVGNQLLHLCGNITQYAIASLGQTEDKRDRNSEFEAEGGLTKAELNNKLSTTVAQAIHTMRHLERSEMMRVRPVQGFNHTGIAIIMHVVEHYSYHTGQIAFWTKLLKDKNLGFYDHVDLNIKNEG